MKPFKILFYYFLFLSYSSWAVSFDWSGWARLDSYYQHEGNYYGSFHSVLNSDIFITDSLSFKSRIDLFPFLKEKSLAENYLLFETAYRQTGFVFLYKEEGKKARSELPLVFFLPTQFYVDYQQEFFKVRLGRAPYHFGLGTTYSATNNPFEHWMSLYNQLSVLMEYQSIYIQPALLHGGEPSADLKLLEGELSALLQAGIQQENWKLSALYRHAFERDSLIELFGEYKKWNWDIRASSSYVFKPGVHFSLALEGKMKLPSQIPIQLELKTGGVSGDLAFHPNYDMALLFWNRWMSGKELSAGNYPYQIASGQVQKGIYFSPRAVFSFLDETLRIQPLLLLAGSLEDKKLNYEMDLKAEYQLDENLFFSLTAGALYSYEKLYLSLLAQTAASF
ncbi:MAG: hypothetical protein OXJ52_03885 [Oligoflexia bacterium]|nr:hypothetical protein [Oligoflexia bacterium]